jgi:hypothetical protein
MHEKLNAVRRTEHLCRRYNLTMSESKSDTGTRKRGNAGALWRRRRLKELHPDKLGREQTSAELAEYTSLASGRKAPPK